MAKPGEFWIVDEVIAHVENGEVTISIQRPVRSLPKEKANEVSDRMWLEAQLQKLHIARRRGDTTDIPLADYRFRRSSLRLGGGFLIIQGKQIILIRRSNDAPRRACQLCECGGIFEVIDTDPFHPSNDFIASLLKESAELALISGNRVYVPEFAIGKASLSFQPPGLQASEYDDMVLREVRKELESAKIPVTNGGPEFLKFHAGILNYENSVKLQFADSPTISVDFTAELDTSSLEFVGVLSFPDNLDLAAIAYLEGKSVLDETERVALKVLKRQYEKDIRTPLEYWDTECQDKPLNRDILIIDIKSGNTNVWYTPREDSNGKPIAQDAIDRERLVKESDLWTELSKTHLAATGGRHTTEKAEKAIKMHCPLHFLQPLITL